MPAFPADPIHLEEITAATPAPVLAQSRQMLLEYGRFVIAQPGAARFCFGSLEDEAAHLPQSFLEQGGGFLVAFVHRAPAACVAWRALPPSAVIAPQACELKRLWVRPAARGLGLGRILTQAAIDRAVATGYRAMYLDTAPASMAAAHRMYLDLGFEPCPAYNDNPVEELAYLVKVL